MEKKGEAKVKLPPIDQIGIVVKDAQKTANNYSSIFGIGPFTIQEFDMRQDNVILYSKPAGGKLRIAFAQIGSIEIELIQVLEGGEYYSQFLHNKGEGLHHLGVRIQDLDSYDRLLTELAGQGIKPVMSRRDRKSAFAYLDTQAIGGVILELIYAEKGA